MRSFGFTLVELLVVITIIVVLLSLLTPALDEAVYQAELTKCGAQLKSYATALTTGAVERRRSYPRRLGSFQPIDLNDPNGNDERPELIAYLGSSLNPLLNCPLTIPVDIDNTQINMYAQTSYAMWHGWRTGPTERRMARLGDDWTWDGQSFQILIQDYELWHDGFKYIYSGQPDRAGVLVPYVVQDAGNQTTSTWYGNPPRGPIAINAAHTDASVQRTADIPAYQLHEDERTVRVPNQLDANHTNDWQRVPLRP